MPLTTTLPIEHLDHAVGRRAESQTAENKPVRAIRRAGRGFKIRRGNPSCEFESHLRHKVKTAATALFSGFRGWGLWAIPWAILLVLVTCACDARFYVAESGAGGAGGEGGMGGAALGGAAGAVAEADGMAGAGPEPEPEPEPYCIHSIGDQRWEPVSCEGDVCTVALTELHHWQCSDGRVWEEERTRFVEHPNMGGAGGAP